MRALELRSAMVSHWKLTMTNWEQSSKLTLLTQEVGKELNINHFMVIQDLKQIGKVNKLDKWIPHELTANQKLSFWSVLFYVTTAKLFLIGLWCVMKVDFIWQLATTSSMAEPEEATKHFSQANLHEKKVMITVWRSAADLIHYSFLNPAKPLHLRNMLSKLKICTENRNACNQHWPTERAQFSTTMPNHMLHNQDFKSWTNWATKFCVSTMFTWPLKVNYYFFKQLNNFLQGKRFYNQQEAENAFQGFVKSQSMGFYATGINKHFSLAKMCWL